MIVILVVAALIAVMLILVILVQSPKGRGLDSALGGAAANTVLGASQSADFIEKLTWGLAGSICLICLSVAFILKPVSNTPQQAPAAQKEAPAAPAKK